MTATLQSSCESRSFYLRVRRGGCSFGPGAMSGFSRFPESQLAAAQPQGKPFVVDAPHPRPALFRHPGAGFIDTARPLPDTGRRFAPAGGRGSGPVVTRKLFQIGFNKCATTFIARLFQMNGIPTVHWLEGALAEDIAYSRLAGRAPLQRWADKVVAFTDMESVRYLNMPVVEAFRDYAFLDASFPGSVFVLNTRNVEDWVISRYMHRGGSYARAYAQILGVGPGDLADIWADSWQRHLDGVRAHFVGRPELVEIDIDTATPEDYRRALSPWFDLPLCPPLPSGRVRKARNGYLIHLGRMLDAPLPGEGVSPALRQQTATALAAAARPATVQCGAGAFSAASDLFATFDAARQEVRARDGSRLPLIRGDSGKYHLDPAQGRLLRLATTVNDIADVADHGIYHLDMAPVCPLGQGDHAIPGPVIAGSRRAGSANVFLWPMPWIHRLGNDGFLGTPGRVDPAFADKLDRAVWRGGFAGYARGTDGPDLNRRLDAAIGALSTADLDTPGLERASASLRDSARLAFVLAAQGNPDIDAAFLPDERAGKALTRAGIADVFARDHDEAFLLKHRYLVCLGGNAGPEDFLPLANSHSVVLKEEDGWELFASDLFRPWEHYIPLAPGGTDLAEALAWARAHPDRCAEISAAARQLCAVLADPECRRLHLTQVLRDYRAASGQGE